jgi:hypothetical protein
MVDDTDKTGFAARFYRALEISGVERKEFAKHFGPAGQQIINGWLKRGRIGQPSVPTVRALLPLVDMVWLNEGVLSGSRTENFSHGLQKESQPQSQFVSLDRDTLHEALTLLVYDEHPEAGAGPYKPRARTERLAHLYEWVQRDGGRLSAVSNAEFMRQVTARRLKLEGFKDDRDDT